MQERLSTNMQPLKEVLWGAVTEMLEQTQYTQPALFAVEYALAELWSWGIEPVAVLGTASGVCGGMCGRSIPAGGRVELIAARGRLMQG
jgi:acyl transferase domain-containing protein